MLKSLTQKYSRDFKGFGGAIPKFSDEKETKRWWKH